MTMNTMGIITGSNNVAVPSWIEAVDVQIVVVCFGFALPNLEPFKIKCIQLSQFISQHCASQIINQFGIARSTLTFDVENGRSLRVRGSGSAEL